VGDRLSLVIQTVSAALVASIMGLVISWRLALVMIAVQPLIIICFYSRSVLLKSMSKKSIKGQSESSKLAAEAVSNLRSVQPRSEQSWSEDEEGQPARPGHARSRGGAQATGS